MSNKNNVQYVLFGVTFNHSFSILDYWGSIADDILYKCKYFGSEFFDNISTQYTTERTLRDSKTNNYLKLTSNQLIFKYNIKSDFVKEWDCFCEKITEYLVPKILSKYNLRIRRIGIVFCNEIDDNAMKKFVSKYFKPEINGVSEFRFSMKEENNSALYWKNTDNYINKIFNIGKVIDGNKNGIVYDYQLYFSPIQADIRDKCSTFLKQGKHKFDVDVTGELE
ncbi:MAG: hypothetical protein ACLRZ9_13065 [Eubacterium sp.]